jgi:Protein of unknown function (DUF2946)
MSPFWNKKIITTWIAIFAILLSALAPSISSALTVLTVRNGNSPSWAEICSTSNSTASVNKKTQSSTSDAHESKHCPFCLPHAGNFALPPAAMPCCAVAAGHDTFPPLYYQAPSLLFSWVTANPRGPPPLS